ncbi:MAG TPA: DNRLRE domain-containing protein [Woeseiaceae bacterium]|nr:DNRLRE domain-containing protein [Woeseiaceae bacterium]
MAFLDRARQRVLITLSLFAVASTAFASHAEDFIESDIIRPDGAAWQEAVGVTFQDSGRTWVWERVGRVWIVDSDNPVMTPFLDISDEVGAWWDHGLLGLALDPEFDQNGYVYVLYLVDRHQLLHCHEPVSGMGEPICDAGYNPATDDYFSATIGRLTRYQATLPSGASDYSQATTADRSTRTVLIGSTITNGIPSTSRSHVTGSLIFGTDGSLLVSTGDGARATRDSGSASTTGDGASYTAQALVDGIIDDAQDVGANRAQMIDSLSGKILRLNPATGAGLPSNPWYDTADPDAARSRAYALGFRNPFRMSLRPNTGSHDPAAGDPGTIIVGDVGRQDWEEINIVEASAQNFGWPIFEGMQTYPGSDFSFGNVPNAYAPNPLFGQPGCSQRFLFFSDLIVQETRNAVAFPNPCNAGQLIDNDTPTHVHTRPILTWRHGVAVTRAKAFGGTGEAVDYSIDDPNSPIHGTPFSGSTATGGFVYTGTDLPAEYRGNYFFGDYADMWIRRLVFDEFGLPLAVEEFAGGGEVGGPVHITSNPVTGGIYYIPWTIAVKRLDYAPDGTLPPVIELTTSALFGPAPLNVAFDASASFDPEGTSLSYYWDFDDGANATGPVSNHVFAAASVATFNVRLTVRDSNGGQAQRTIVVSPNNTPPSVAIVSPADGSAYPLSGDTEYALLADIRDTEHSAESMTCKWTVRLFHNTHSHGSPPVAGCATTTTIAPEGCDGDSYFYQVDLEVTDPAGLVATDTVILNTPSCSGGNFSPVANGDIATVNAGGSVVIPVLANDIDDTGLIPGTVALRAPAPTQGTVNVNAATGDISYQHTGSAGSVDTFAYTVQDTAGVTSNTATVVVRSIAPDTESPTEPGDFVAVSAITNQISLDWDPSNDNVAVAGYRLYRDSGLIADIAVTSFTDVNLDPDTIYNYAVEAYDSSGNTSSKAVIAVATLAVPNEVTFETSADSYTRTNAASANFGTETIVRVQPWGDMAGFLRFDFSAFPAGSAVATAILNLPVDDVKVDGVVELRRVLGPWQELTLTRNNQPGLGPVAALFTVARSDENEVVSVDVTSLVNELLADPANDYGIALTQAGANVWFDSREAGSPISLTLTGGGPLPNSPPTVSAGTDETVFLGDGAALAGNVTDDGLPDPPAAVITSWTKVSGPGTADFSDPALPATTVNFGEVGEYVLRLAADDGEYLAFDDVRISVVEPGAQVNISAGADTYTRRNAASANFGTDSIVRVQPWGNATGFVRFDLSAFPAGSTVASATLHAAVDDVKVVGGVQLHRVLGPWQEFALSYNNQPALGPVAASLTVDKNDKGEILNIDVTNLVNALIADPANDHGIAFTQDGANVWFDSREGGIPMLLTINAGGPVTNAPPSVNAGADTSIALPNVLSLAGKVTDDGLPNPPANLTVSWTQQSGPGTATFTNAANPASRVSFDIAGDYVLQLAADDGEFVLTDDVTVTVLEPQPEFEFTAVADSYTRTDPASSNFGSEAIVRVQPWRRMTGFVRFDLASFPTGSGVASAVLELSVNDVKVDGSIEFQKVLGNWQELGLTRDNQPDLGPVLATLGVSGTDDGQLVSVDITSLVNTLLADPANDFGIALTQSGANVWFDSREAGAPMTLTIVPGSAPP